MDDRECPTHHCLHYEEEQLMRAHATYDHPGHTETVDRLIIQLVTCATVLCRQGYHQILLRRLGVLCGDVKHSDDVGYNSVLRVAKPWNTLEL